MDASILALRVMLLLALLGAGCTTSVMPPSRVSDPVEIYLTDYGRHSSIVLPDPAGGFDEYAYGDYDWFALGHANFWTGLRAAFASPKATLGRRHLAGREGTLSTGDLACETLSHFSASQARAQALRTRLATLFESSRDPPVFSNFSGLDHVPDSEHYWLFHNCNHATAEWLRELGCTTCGPAILSKFVVQQPP